MIPRPLESYAESIEVKSATSDRVYVVIANSCACKFFEIHQGKPPCRHQLESRLRLAELERDLAQPGYPSEALEQYEALVDRVTFFRSGEAKGLAALALSIGRLSPGHVVTADAVYAAHGGKDGFDGDPRLVGCVFTRLLKAGLVEGTGYEASRRNHARPIRTFRLTPAGLAASE
jgi:hypothetical protein